MFAELISMNLKIRVGLALVVFVGVVASAIGAIPRPEHPRPDACRTNWLSLNGEWQFEIDRTADGDARGFDFGSGLGREDNRAFLS